MKIRIMMVSIVFAFSSAVFADENEDRARSEIREVIEAFRLSIIEKDEERFHSLFYDKSIPWLRVLGHKRTGTLPSQLGVGPG